MGSTNDISPLLCFHFWEPVYYKLDNSDFLSDSREKCGHFVGISESVRHAMTFKILTDDTLKVIHRSNVRLALNPHAKNLRLDPLEEITSEPLNIFGTDNPVTCAVYAREHRLLEEEGWKRFRGIAKREKKMLRMVNQSRIKATRNAPRYKFGYCIPRNYSEAMQFDLKNGNTLW
jgi:hypothetical protein